MRVVKRLALVGLAVLALGCHDEEGDDQTLTFVTSRSETETHERATAFFAGSGYAIVDSGSRLIRAQKRRPLASGGGDQVDVLTVQLSNDPAGTRVSLHAITYIIENNNQRQAPQVSAEALRDIDLLAQHLMVRP